VLRRTLRLVVQPVDRCRLPARNNPVERAVNKLKRDRAVALRTHERLYVCTSTRTINTIDNWLNDRIPARSGDHALGL
jgi:hypothetical protein